MGCEFLVLVPIKWIQSPHMLKYPIYLKLISSGQEGACYGSTIGGSINLKRTRTNFKTQKWNANFTTGFETNNQQKILGSAINYVDSLVYVDVDFMYRDAENYKAGNNKEVLFSQFKKKKLFSDFRF
jgi:iron complex outermembrane receptor protein